MALNRKSPIVKRDQARLPEIHHLTESKGASYPPGSMLIASPLEIGKVVQKIPSGTVMTLPDLRHSLANKFKADYTCPLTTGIFLRILADAAEEEGSTASCPYWRVVRADGRLIDRSPGGEAAKPSTSSTRESPSEKPARPVGKLSLLIKSAGPTLKRECPTTFHFALSANPELLSFWISARDGYQEPEPLRSGCPRTVPKPA